MSCCRQMMPSNCGSFGGENGIKLKNCTACLLVKYWSSVSGPSHRKKHKKHKKACNTAG